MRGLAGSVFESGFEIDGWMVYPRILPPDVQFCPVALKPIHRALRNAIFLLALLIVAPPLLAAEVSLDQFMTRRGYSVVAMKHGYKNRFYADARLNGKPLRCLIDTGCSDLIVDRRKVVGLKTSTAPPQLAYTPFGRISEQFRVANLDRLELGPASFTNHTAVVFDLHKDREVKTGSFIPTSSRSDDFDLILGLGFLSAAHAMIGCEAPALYLRQEPLTAQQAQNLEASLSASGYSSASFLSNGLPYIRAAVDGKEALLVIDTGAMFTAFDVELLTRFGLDDERTGGKLKDAAERNRDLRYSRVNSIKLGKFDTGPMPVGVADFSELRQRSELLRQRGLPPLLGFIGPEVLYRSRAIIDCTTGTAYFKQ